MIDGEQRQLMRLQTLYNQICYVHQGADTWSPDDAAMLRTLWPHVNKFHLIRSNLQVLKVPKAIFERWVEQWAHQPERFIERRSRLPYSYEIPEATVRIELECRGETSKLSALVKMSDGRTIPYCDVERRLGAAATEVMINGQPATLELPLSRQLMDQVFGSKNPMVPTRALVRNLPVLLENRLDLLTGPSVTHAHRRGKIKIKLVPDGADVKVEVKIGSIEVQSLNLDAPCKLVRDKQRFIVVEGKASRYPQVRKVLAELPLQVDSRGGFRLPGEPANMAALAEGVRRLPDVVELVVDPDLQNVLLGEANLVPQLSLQAGDGWVDVDVSCRLGDMELTPSDFDALRRSKTEFIRTRSGSWLHISAERMSKFLTTLNDMSLEYGRQRKLRAEAQAMVKGFSKLPDLRIPKSSQELVEELRNIPDVETIEVAGELQTILRPYQLDGANFLYNRTGYEVGCILADDMGLGKTVQALAFIETVKRVRDPKSKVLVVCPASVVSVWLNEARHFTPKLKVRGYVGSPEERQLILDEIGKWDILVANYAIVRNDFEKLKDLSLGMVILDEAQQIKNPDAQITRSIKNLHTKYRIALTGTPLENRLLDLWSIVDFLNPGYLEDQDSFKDRYVNTTFGHEKLARRIAPLMLRRTKHDVAPELPARIEEHMLLPMTERQGEFYERQLAMARKDVQNGGFMQVLAALTRLRQICCHPSLVSGNGKASFGEMDSGKLECLVEMLEELVAEGHSALVFSQFTSMLQLIEDQMTARGIEYFKIIGATPTSRRAEIVDNFTNSGKPSVFLLSLRAAGTGLTLTKADYVFIYDPWWNPAVENQAIDRTHRIGQDKPVIAYRLITENSVEEKVMALQAEKRQLFEELVDGAKQLPVGLTAEDLVSLLA